MLTAAYSLSVQYFHFVFAIFYDFAVRFPTRNPRFSHAHAHAIRPLKVIHDLQEWSSVVAPFVCSTLFLTCSKHLYYINNKTLFQLTSKNSKKDKTLMLYFDGSGSNRRWCGRGFEAIVALVGFSNMMKPPYTYLFR